MAIDYETELEKLRSQLKKANSEIIDLQDINCGRQQDNQDQKSQIATLKSQY